MAFLTEFQADEIKKKLIEDKSILGKLFKAKKNSFQTISVDHSLVDDYLKRGWEVHGKPLKTKTKLKIAKDHSKQFEDDLWCQFYNLGFRHLNFDENLILPFSKDPKDTKQIDVVAIKEDTIFLIECKSSEKLGPSRLLKDEFELLKLRLDGFKKALWQIYGRDKKVKYIFATRNLRISPDSIHIQRLEDSNAFYFNNNTFDYVNSLIKNYKNAAFYQFLGLVFKNEIINQNKIEIPAVKGQMGNKDYYMFSIEPSLLLKMGFVLHRTRANESEFPTYQRLLVPLRLKGITKFIDEGGYFPNSIILNFNTKKNKVKFEANSKPTDSNACSGKLIIPNAYGIAYIIDGQHRVYGYANSKYVENNTIPVVAFDGLDTIEQLEIFMDINQNQKAVSPSLRLDLEEDLYWDSDRIDSRLKALRSSIIKMLANSESSPLFNMISVGEDKAALTFKPFTTAISNSNLLPTAKGNKYNSESLIGSLYDTNNQDHNKEMYKAKKKVVDFLISCYEFVEQQYPEIFTRDKYFIVSNRGTYAFISVVGSLNKFETERGTIDLNTDTETRFNAIKKYLTTLLYKLSSLDKDEEERQLTLLGSGADTKWLRFFQSLIHSEHYEYNPPELIDWNERQNEELQSEGRKYGVEIEKFIKKQVLNNLKSLFVENWELEINSIKRECLKRAEEEKERNYKEGLGAKEIHWTEMFNINDYKTIIKKYFTKSPEDYGLQAKEGFTPFREIFSIDIGEGFNSNDQRIKWISRFNSYRNLWAHEGTKEKRLNKQEVAFLENIHGHFYEKS
jgi:DNA sulfur modification protein DndB